MHANIVQHFAVHATDLDRAKKFYSGVFGWKFEEWGPPDFYLIATGTPETPGIRGALQKREGEVGEGVNGYECSVSVANVAETAKKIREHGGKIVTEEMEIPTVGKIVRFQDTEGNFACAIQYEPGAV
ncbi:MAG: VOC family protein [Pirellulaceae bacterium]